MTGGGPGLMEAANRGASEAGGLSVGLGIELAHEQGMNAWVDLGVHFRYFFARKTMFVKYAQGFIVLPGGFGTFDELFESVTLVQTQKVTEFPIVLVGRRTGAACSTGSRARCSPLGPSPSVTWPCCTSPTTRRGGRRGPRARRPAPGGRGTGRTDGRRPVLRGHGGQGHPEQRSGRTTRGTGR